MMFKSLIAWLLAVLENEWRNLFSKKLLRAMEGMKVPKDMFIANIIVSVGGAFCNDAIILARFFHYIKTIYSIDPNFAPYKGFKRYIIHIQKKIQDVKLSEIGGNGKKIIESSHVAQTFKTDAEKIVYFNAIRNIMREGEWFIFIEEARRAGIWGYYDRILHYLYNNKGFWDFVRHLIYQNINDGYYIKADAEEYRALAEQCGFEMMETRQFFRGSFISFWKAVSRKE